MDIFKKTLDGLREKASHVINRLPSAPMVRFALNRLYGRFGEMTQLKIDREHKTIDAEVLLTGEKEQIQVHVGKYEVRNEGEQCTLTLADVTVSREWLNLLARELLVNRPVPLPPEAARWLRLVL